MDVVDRGQKWAVVAQLDSVYQIRRMYNKDSRTEISEKHFHGVRPREISQRVYRKR